MKYLMTTLLILSSTSKPADDFVDSFCDQIKLLIPHSFIAKQQSLYQTDTMSNLMPGHFLVICDFSDNYSFVLQDAAQGFHWNNSQATLHPFVAYYKESGELQHISFVIISDCLHHDTIAVHLAFSVISSRKVFESRQDILFFR